MAVMTVVIGVIEKVWWGKRENINEGKKKKVRKKKEKKKKIIAQPQKVFQ